MSRPTWPFGQPAAIEYLRQLLLDPKLPYRLKWAQRAERQSSAGRINTLAVARFLIESGTWGVGMSPKKIKDSVHRALTSGQRQLLSAETLARFIQGFQFSDAEAQRLQALLAGAPDEASDTAIGELPVPSHQGSLSTAGRVAPSHTTLSLHELHYVGADGLPEHHRTIQVVQSLVDGWSRYPYQFDTCHAEVRVARGGQVGDVKPVDGTLYSTEIILDHPLAQGEITTIEYDTEFSYPADAPPAPEFRRGARGRTKNLELYVHFVKRPDKIWWAKWDGYTDSAEVVSQEGVHLGSDGSVMRFLSSIERTVVGYHWLYQH